MNKTILPGARTGEVHIPASKSQAHRMLLCAAMGENEVTLRCRGLSKDILATSPVSKRWAPRSMQRAKCFTCAPFPRRRRGFACSRAVRAVLPCAFCCPWWERWALRRYLSGRGGCRSVRSSRWVVSCAGTGWTSAATAHAYLAADSFAPGHFPFRGTSPRSIFRLCS